MRSGFCVKYDLYYNNEKIPLENVLVNVGVKSGDTIILVKRNTFQIFQKTLTGENITLDVNPFDSIKLYKIFCYYRIGMPLDEQRIIFAGKQLEDNHTIAYYKKGGLFNYVIR